MGVGSVKSGSDIPAEDDGWLPCTSSQMRGGGRIGAVTRWSSRHGKLAHIGCLLVARQVDRPRVEKALLAELFRCGEVGGIGKPEVGGQHEGGLGDYVKSC